MSQTKVLIFAGIMLVSLSATAYSQPTFASITGTVTDATGAVVPGATVTATNVATNIRTSTQTNEAGNYAAQQLPVGRYEVAVESAGFRRAVRRDIGKA